MLEQKPCLQTKMFAKRCCFAPKMSQEKPSFESKIFAPSLASNLKCFIKNCFLPRTTNIISEQNVLFCGQNARTKCCFKPVESITPIKMNANHYREIELEK